MAAAITPYYEALFSPKASNETAAAACLHTLRSGNRVLPPTATRCGADITDDETERICEKVPAGKSAGPDRIPNKFYRVFSKIIAPILTRVFNEAMGAAHYAPRAQRRLFGFPG